MSDPCGSICGARPRCLKTPELACRAARECQGPDGMDRTASTPLQTPNLGRAPHAKDQIALSAWVG